MHFKLSARELEILEDRETILKRLADNQVRVTSAEPTDLMKDHLSSNHQIEIGLAHFDHKINNRATPDGSNSGITVGVAESTLLDIEKPRINAIFCSL